MEKVQIKEAKRAFCRFLVEHSGCSTQDGKDGMSYPCGTCVIALFDAMGLKQKDAQYEDHNEELDRANEVWRAILQIRDYKVK